MTTPADPLTEILETFAKYCLTPENGTQKPLEMFEWLVKTYSDEGDLVVDPFAGSGTTLLAAQNLNRKYQGAEKLEKYREIIKERLV